MTYGLSAWLEVWMGHRKECAIERELEALLDEELDRELEALLNQRPT